MIKLKTNLEIIVDKNTPTECHHDCEHLEVRKCFCYHECSCSSWCNLFNETVVNGFDRCEACVDMFGTPSVGKARNVNVIREDEDKYGW